MPRSHKPNYYFIPAALGLTTLVFIFLNDFPELSFAADVFFAFFMLLGSSFDGPKGAKPILLACLACSATMHFVQSIVLSDGTPPILIAAASVGALISIAVLLSKQNSWSAERREMETMIETVPTLLWRADGQSGGVDFMNRRWGEMGWGLEDLGGDKWTVMMHPEDQERLIRAWQHSVDTSTPYEEIMRTLRADGEYRWTVIRAAPDFESDGSVRKWYGMASDIDDLVRAEERLEIMRNELAHATRVSTLGELAASIAHEINQPLGSVVTNGQVALRWLDRDPSNMSEIHEAVSATVIGAKRASQVVERLRFLFRKSSPQFLPLDVNEMVTDSVALVAPMAKRSDVSILTELNSDPIWIEGDAIQLQQVLINLIVNGIEALKLSKTSRKVTIRTSLGVEGNALIQVEDTGPGISKKDMNSIFAAFYSTKDEGLGMGLAICSTILDGHEGRIEAFDAPDGGALFTVSLPVSKAKTEADRAVS